MPVDGTYGRLNAHNQRFKELRRKKLERREKKMLQNKLKNTFNKIENSNLNPEKIDPIKLEKLKIEIRKKAKAELKRELYRNIILFLIVCIFIYFLFFN